MIGVGEDEIHAFLDVETRGHGFDAQGQPVILFEPHVFFRNLSGTKRAQAMALGLAYAEWGEQPYPRDSYPRLKAACAIDEAAALKSASWGLGQVLGENFEAAGFPTVQAMVEAMMADEELQLDDNCAVMIGQDSPRAITAPPSARMHTTAGLPTPIANGRASRIRHGHRHCHPRPLPRPYSQRRHLSRLPSFLSMRLLPRLPCRPLCPGQCQSRRQRQASSSWPAPQ
jgi:hypothetical protein